MTSKRPATRSETPSTSLLTTSTGAGLISAPSCVSPQFRARAAIELAGYSVRAGCSRAIVRQQVGGSGLRRTGAARCRALVRTRAQAAAAGCRDRGAVTARWLVPKSSTSSIRCAEIELDVRAGLGETPQRLSLALGPDIEVLLVQLVDPGRHGPLPFRPKATTSMPRAGRPTPRARPFTAAAAGGHKATCGSTGATGTWRATRGARSWRSAISTVSIAAIAS